MHFGLCTNIKRLIILFIGMTLACASLSAQTLIQSDRRGTSRYYGRRTHQSNYGLLTGAYTGQHQLLGVQLDGGYSRYLNRLEGVTPAPGGYTIGAGLTYMYQDERLIVQTGLTLRWHTSLDTMGHYTRIDHSVDSRGWPYELRYDFDHRRDLSRNLYMEVPLQVGAYIVGGLYATAGIKARVQVYNHNSATAIASTSASYDRYIGDWEEMDIHGLRKEVPISYAGTGIRMWLDLAAVAELGYEFQLPDDNRVTNRRRDNTDRRIRLAAYADVTAFSLRPSSSEPVYFIPSKTPYDFATFEMRHPMHSIMTEGQQVRGLNVGLKITCFFWGIESQDVRVSVSARGKRYIRR